MNGQVVFEHIPDSSIISTRRRNYKLQSHRKDQFIEWIKSILYHSFVLNAPSTYYDSMSYFEELVAEHKLDPIRSRLKLYVPTIGLFHTLLPMRKAFKIYDEKYFISKRKHIPPSFNEIRHILNLAQVIGINNKLSMISFDGDQTLYNDGGNFDENNNELARSICDLLVYGVKVCVITAASYGLESNKYENRLQGLLNKFIEYNLLDEQIENFYICGGECNYLFKCKVINTLDNREAKLVVVNYEEWQAEALNGPRPFYWPYEQINQILDIAENIMINTIKSLHLRVNILRKERAVGIYPGGLEMLNQFPQGHGSNKIKQEALDELVFNVMEGLRNADPPITIPYCVFNGGKDAWLDVGNKSVAVAALQAYFHLPTETCLHVGDQFLSTGNDIAARSTCPCIWITSPLETAKILQHVLKYMGIAGLSRSVSRHCLLNDADNS